MSSAKNLPPAIPAFILRGHTASVHSLQFYKKNAFLISGDSEGWIVAWSLTSKRSMACWRAHEGSILGIKEWDSSVITHGRDHKLRVWQLTNASLDGETLDSGLPAEGGPHGIRRREPWLLHSLDMSALNFCAFALCPAFNADDRNVAVGQVTIAVPDALDSGGIDFFHLPSERRVSVLEADPQIKTGMVMALNLFHHPQTATMMVVSGYEDGHTFVHRQKSVPAPEEKWIWEKILVSQPHSQPVLSLDVGPSKDFYFTSSADAVIAKLAIPSSHLVSDPEVKPARINNTRHAGQQDLTLRNDGKIFATAGWDARIRVYSAKTLQELAVLKWHQDGCYSVAFADIFPLDALEGCSESGGDQALAASKKSTDSALEVIKYQRSMKSRTTHWLAAGGKDGKISLWDMY